MVIFVGGVTGSLDFSAPPNELVTGVFICAAAVDVITAVLLCGFMRKRSMSLQKAEYVPCFRFSCGSTDSRQNKGSHAQTIDLCD